MTSLMADEDNRTHFRCDAPGWLTNKMSADGTFRAYAAPQPRRSLRAVALPAHCTSAAICGESRNAYAFRSKESSIRCGIGNDSGACRENSPQKCNAPLAARTLTLQLRRGSAGSREGLARR